MRTKNNWKQSMAASLLITISLILTFVAVSLAVINVTDTGLEAFVKIFGTLWPLFSAILFVVSFLALFFFRFPMQFLFICLLLASFVFIFSSFNGNDSSLFVRNYIDSIFNIGYLATGVTISALLLAILAVGRSNPDEEE